MGALKTEDRKSRAGICRTNIPENARPEKAELDFEGPFRRSKRRYERTRLREDT